MDGAAGATDRELTYREKRVLFSQLLAAHVLWANEQPTREVAFDEGTVKSPRKVRSEGARGYEFEARDAVHISGSYHHVGLACDLILYINGVWISDGGNPAWTLMGEHWERQHPLCTWGGRFKIVDSGHFSMGEALHLKQARPA